MSCHAPLFQVSPPFHESCSSSHLQGLPSILQFASLKCWPPYWGVSNMKSIRGCKLLRGQEQLIRHLGGGRVGVWGIGAGGPAQLWKDQGGQGTLFPAWFFPSFGRSTILQQQFNRTGKVEHGSVALPAVMRSGSTGPEIFNVGSMPSPQQQVMVGQMHRAHMPPLVSHFPLLSKGGVLVTEPC